jgi:hypothetical protein
MYQKYFVDLFTITIQNGNESIVSKLLLQLNFISCLSNALDELVKNDVPLKIYNIDTFLSSLKMIVERIDAATKVK